MRGATKVALVEASAQGISIHAPHAGRDGKWEVSGHFIRYFNPRAPCGARLSVDSGPSFASEFQSTRPMRGATLVLGSIAAWERISIHAPHAGRDERRNYQNSGSRTISIHAPHAGRDEYDVRVAFGQNDFNPRAPCGARQQKYTKLLYTLLRQKAILRQFHAKRRLLKRFSTYKYRNTFLICSANRMGKICTLPLRTTRSLDLPEGMSACSQSARFCFRTFFPSSKTADYPAPDP